MNTYSYSRLTMFETCQRSYYHKYVEGRPYPANAPMRMGKIFHSAISLMITQGYSPEEAAYCAAYEEGGLPENEKMSFLVSMLHKAHERLPDGEYTDRHSEIQYTVKLPSGNKLTGFIDLMLDDPSGNTLEIWDFKTSWRSSPAEQSRQLKLYAWMTMEMMGWYVPEHFIGRLIFPRLLPSEDTEVAFTDEMMKESLDWAEGLIAEIENKNFLNIHDWKQTKQRNACDNCPFAALCSGGFISSLPSDGVAKDDEEAQHIGSFILAQEKILSDLKAGLKAYVKDKGDVAVGTGKWTFQESEPNPKVDDIGALTQFALEHDLYLSDVLTPNTKVLKEWVAGDKTGDLQKLVSWTKPRKTFKFVK